MATKLEATKNYLVNIAERTIGVNAYKRWQEYAKVQTPENPVRRGSGILVGAIQFLMPGSTDGVAELWMQNIIRGEKGGNTLIEFTKFAGKVGLDYASWNLVALANHNPLEFVAWKLAVNAATPVIMDLASTAINRMKHFRPSSVTLAA